ncbi:hypothetical protein L1987_36875 [Smallanthus sonchifolius]|uniref:Uncharacterized protein n=1 Tax=Smallanthus sonchifolius TaxID=185202 RepID=A0ACB9HG54_9ASTR|nr:hypothetical protein L1987_36875 [Smallanthus sonchifolius]
MITLLSILNGSLPPSSPPTSLIFQIETLKFSRLLPQGSKNGKRKEREPSDFLWISCLRYDCLTSASCTFFFLTIRPLLPDVHVAL